MARILLVMAMVVMGATASAAPAAKPVGDVRADAVPASVIAAFAEIDEAADARNTGATTAFADAALAGGLEHLAQAYGDVRSDALFAATLQVEAHDLAPVLGARRLTGSLDAELASALDEVASARRAWVDRRVASGGQDDPITHCFEAYGACMTRCSVLPDPFLRSLCGMDCTMDLYFCLAPHFDQIHDFIRALDALRRL